MNIENMYSVQDFEDSRFYQLPKQLFGNENYKGLSLAAKTVYSVLRDRQDLSVKNNWVDDNGKIFFYFDGEKLSELLEVHVNTIIKYKKELEKYKLLLQVRQGLGKPNRLYVMKPIKSQNHNFSDSRNTKNGIQESQKNYTNDTEYSETELNDTENINNTSALGKTSNAPRYNNTYEMIVELSRCDNFENNTRIVIVQFMNRFKTKFKCEHFILDNKESVVAGINNLIDYVRCFYSYNTNDLLIEYIESFLTWNDSRSIYTFVNPKTVNYYFNKLGYIDSEAYDSDGEVMEMV